MGVWRGLGSMNKGPNATICLVRRQNHAGTTVSWTTVQRDKSSHAFKLSSNVQTAYSTDSLNNCPKHSILRFSSFALKIYLWLKMCQHNLPYLKNLLESLPGKCIWNLKQFGKVSIFDRKMPTAPDLTKNWNFDISQSSPKFIKLTEFIGITSRNMYIWSSLEKFQFLTESCQQCRPLKRMKFWHFLKILRNSWNLQNLLESPPGTCMWNLKQFGEVSIFDRKMPTAPDLRKRMKFWHFSKFSKIHETYRIYWNHLQEHACEIWRSLEKFQFLTEKCRQRLDLRKRMKFWHFSKFSEIHETYRIYWNHLQEHVCEIWSSLEKFQFLTESCQRRRTLEKGWTLTFSQSSPKFMKLTEFIGLTSRNMHVKFGAV